MMTGSPTTWKAGKINYKVLGKINPEAARLAVIECLSPDKGNISEAARVLGIPQSQAKFQSKSQTFFHSSKTKILNSISSFLLDFGNGQT